MSAIHLSWDMQNNFLKKVFLPPDDIFLTRFFDKIFWTRNWYPTYYIASDLIRGIELWADIFMWQLSRRLEQKMLEYLVVWQ